MFGAARDGLLREIQRMGGTGVILSTNLPLRRDGLPYADAKTPEDSGVAVYFKYKKKPMTLACDQYFRVSENARALAMTIEALRGIERWGASDLMERAFRGFTALPEKAGEYWRDILGFEPERKVSSDEVETAFRRLAHVAHPDKGGTLEQWQQLVNARENAMKDLGITR